MLRVGLTGGIGAGKSTVAGALARRGAVVVDADQLARRVVEPGSAGLAAVVEAFGPQVLTTDGALDRPALGRLVFGDEGARARLNAIVHPLVARLTAREIAAAPRYAVVVHDVPLLVENGLGAHYHLVVVVTAPEDVRVRRLVTDRGMSEPEARARMAAQADDDARAAAADVRLDNGGPPADVVAAVERLWDDRLLPYEANVRARRPAPRPAVIAVVDHDPGWAAAGARLAARVAHAAGPAALRVDHVGSTAVPGLPAKDVVDLQLLVAGPAAADGVREALADAGFPRLEGEWGDDDVLGPTAPALLTKRLHGASDPGRAVNLHVRQASGPVWRWQLMFRDWLRAHAGEREAYAAAKRAAAGGGAGIDGYVLAEGPWVADALHRARDWAGATGWAPGAPAAGQSAAGGASSD